MSRQDITLAYVSGFLRATVGSVNDYSKEELLSKMEFLSDYIDKSFVVCSAEEIIKESENG